MIQFNLTPVYGVMALNGKYLYDISETDDEYRQDIAEFQIELAWDSDMLMGTRIQKIIWLTNVPDSRVLDMEEKIKQAYKKIGKEPKVSMGDISNNL